MKEIVGGKKGNFFQQYLLKHISRYISYSGIKVFNNPPPPNIRNLFCDAKRFKSELTKYLHLKSFYTLEEYYNSCKS